ncbi:MAG: divalent-cation tolerance protein CutA [Acidimicrobiia bacterium]
MGAHCLVLITCADRDEGRGIARRLVEANVAAGVQLIPIESVYRWEGALVEDDETLLVVKTRTDRFEAISAVVDEMHSYEIPPVLMIRIDEASPRYLDWIDHSVEG